ncbi:acyltransferase [Pantoea sp. 1.19]|uniref:acyltransferase family protein n=1 Tax=Pantoea sp. 1.19 TaxID=1925589 RepID=UPI000948DF98|nr:acyltransferase [Pantoea sp. 1.19]
MSVHPPQPGQRDFVIDLFRFLGLSLIILAHVFPPNGLFQFRTFDVPLMVFVSGMAFCVSRGGQANIIHYFFSRFKRMVLPAWAFITLLYFVIFPLSGGLFDDIATHQQQLSSYKLQGFGYFWVIRVFLLISLFSVVYKFLLDRLSPLALFGLYLLTEVGLSLVFYQFGDGVNKESPIGKLIWQVAFPLLSYGVMFCLGYLYKTGRRDLYAWGGFSLLVMMTMEAWSLSRGHGALLWPQDFKYPPTLFYLSWGIVACAALCALASWLKLQHVREGKLKQAVVFISSNTIWIYFWHIPIVEVFRRVEVTPSVMLKYWLAYTLPVLVVLAQRQLVAVLTRSRWPRVNGLIKTVFTG